jgi:hypothetical protein
MKPRGHLKLVVNNNTPEEAVDLSVYLIMIEQLKNKFSALTKEQLLVKLIIFREAALVDKVLPLARVIEGLALLKEMEVKADTDEMRSMVKNSYNVLEQELRNMVKK